MPPSKGPQSVTASFAPKGLVTPPVTVAKIVAFRLNGMTVTQIADEMDMHASTVSRILNRPEIQAQITADAKRTVEKFRRSFREIVPEAIQVIASAVEAGDVEAAKFVLQGSTVATNKAEVELSPKNPLSGRSQVDLEFIMKHGHLPEEPCVCERPHVKVVEAMLPTAVETE